MTDASSGTNAPLLRTPLYEAHKRLGGRMVPFAGWEMPVQYTGVTDEHHAVRKAAGLFDVSHMGELEMSGEYAGQVVDYLVTNDVSKLQDGQALYTCCCNAGGFVLDDLIVYRAAADKFLIVCNGANRDKIVGVFKKAAENHCTFVDRTDETGLIALQGPKAWSILAKAGDISALAAMPAFHFDEARLFNIDVTVSRTGYTGEDGVEIFVPWGETEKLWNGLLEIGKAEGLKPAGLGARDTLRLECKMALYGHEIDETINPLEAGLGWVTKLEKADFVGKSALVAAKEKGLTRKLVGLEMVGRGIGRQGYDVRAIPSSEGGEKIGFVTSGSPSPTLGKNIALAYVPNAQSALGTKVFVDCRGKDIEAVVVKTPFYKRSK